MKSHQEEIDQIRRLPMEKIVPGAIKDLERACPTEWVEVRARLQEAYECCPKPT